MDQNNIIKNLSKLFSITIIMGTVLLILLPHLEVFRYLFDYLVHVLFIVLFLAIISLIIGIKSVMYACFASAFLLAAYLKNASNEHLKYVQSEKSEILTIAHINLSMTTDIVALTEFIHQKDPDIISFQEYTPDWAGIMPNLCGKMYPHSFIDTRIDPQGKAIYSKIDLTEQSKIVFTTGNSLLTVGFSFGEKPFTLYSIYLTPALDNLSIAAAKSEIKHCIEIINTAQRPAIVSGEFNQVYWSNDILDFRSKTQLKNSRRHVMPTFIKAPYDHIFYGEGMECVNFEEIQDNEQNHYGSFAEFQLLLK